VEPYEAYSQLTALPPLVRKQRRLEAQIAPIAPLVDDEKAIRKAIDALLVAAAIAPGDGVTCLGYDVVHHTRKGQSSFNVEVLTSELVAAGLAKDVVAKILIDATETSDPPLWATVSPSRGAKVRR
jgi:hypothetical protein